MRILRENKRESLMDTEGDSSNSPSECKIRTQEDSKRRKSSKVKKSCKSAKAKPTEVLNWTRDSDLKLIQTWMEFGDDITKWSEIAMGRFNHAKIVDIQNRLLFLVECLCNED